MAKDNSTPKPIQLPLILEGATVSILLTKGFVTIVDAIDTDLIYCKWHIQNAKNELYARKSLNHTKNQLMHRIIMSRKLDRELSKTEIVDHIDGDTLNNCRSNLRIATHSENQRNSKKPKNNTSGYKGVHKVGKKWSAMIRAGGKKIYLGTFTTAKLAYEAYCKAAKELHGDFARLE